MSLITVKTGGGGDFDNLKGAVDSLTTLTEDMVIECSGGEDLTTTAIIVNHTDGGFTLTIKASDSDAIGTTFNTDIYHLKTLVDITQLFITSDNVTIEGIQLSYKVIDADSTLITFSNSVGNVNNCILEGGLDSEGMVSGIACVNSSTLTIRNCFVYDLGSQGTSFLCEDSSVIKIYNCTSRGGRFGFKLEALSTATLINVVCDEASQVAFSCGLDECFLTGSNCVSSNIAGDDNSASDLGIGVGNVTVTWDADGSPEFQDTETNLFDQGISTELQGVLTDILGTLRPQGDSYDIGCFEVVVLIEEIEDILMKLKNLGSHGIGAKPFTTSGVVAFAHEVSRTTKLIGFYLHVAALPTSSGALTISRDAVDGTNFDTILYSIDPRPPRLQDNDLVVMFDEPFFLVGGDFIRIDYANADSIQVNLTLIVQEAKTHASM